MDPLPIDFHKDRDVGDVINATFTFIRSEWRLYFKLVFLIGAPLALASSLLSNIGLSALGSPPISTDPGDIDALMNWYSSFFSGPVVTGMLLSFFASGIASAAACAYVVRRAEAPGESIEVGDLVGDIGEHIIGILVGVIILILSMTISSALVLLFCLGLFLGGWLLNMIFVAFPAMFAERRSFFQSLGRASSLLSGSYWASLGLLVIIGVITYLMSMLVALPSSIAGFTWGFNSLSGPAEIPRWTYVFSVLGSLLSIVVLTIPCTAFTIYFYSLRERKEGTGLAARVEALESSLPDEG